MDTVSYHLRRRAGLICLLAAPLLLTVATAVDPALGPAAQAEGGFADAIRADPGAAQLHSLLLHWAWVLYVPALLSLLSPIAASRSGGRRGTVLAAIAWTAITFGLVTFAGLTLGDFFGLAVAQTVDNAAFAEHERLIGSYGWLTVGWQLPGLIGWALAMLVTPFAAARAGVLPGGAGSAHPGAGVLARWWYPIASAAGFGLYLLFAIEPAPLNVLGPLLLTASNLALVARLWRAPDAGSAVGAEPVAAAVGYARWRRTAGLVSLFAAPVALGLGMATMPGGALHIAAFGTDPTATQVSAFFLHLAWLLFIPAVLAVTREIGAGNGRGVLFGQLAGGLAVLGLLHFNGLMIGDYAMLAAETQLSPDQVAIIAERTGDYPMMALGIALPGMLGALLGLVLVPFAAARAGLVRWPVPVLAVAGVLAFFLLTTGRVTGSVSAVLLLASYGSLARALLAQAPRRPAAPGSANPGAGQHRREPPHGLTSSAPAPVR